MTLQQFYVKNNFKYIFLLIYNVFQSAFCSYKGTYVKINLLCSQNIILMSNNHFNYTFTLHIIRCRFECYNMFVFTGLKNFIAFDRNIKMNTVFIYDFYLSIWTIIITKLILADHNIFRKNVGILYINYQNPIN